MLRWEINALFGELFAFEKLNTTSVKNMMWSELQRIKANPLFNYLILHVMYHLHEKILVL